jgi:parallel beta-helix repeat protein
MRFSVACLTDDAVIRRGLMAILVALVLVAYPPAPRALTASEPITLTNQNGIVVSGLSITSTSGPCVQIINSTSITIQGSTIGPCGTDNTTQNSWGIYVSGGSSINIYDNYIHVENLASVCGDSHDGILISDASSVTIQGNVIAYNERNIRIWHSSGVSAIGNFILNPRGAASCSNSDNLGGDQFQAWADDSAPNQNITVSNNYTLNSEDTTLYKYPGKVSDSINFGVTNGVLAQGNYIVGGQYVNGAGLIADYKANSVQFSNNIVSNTFGAGIAIASGTNQTVSGNKVLVLQPSTASTAGTGISNGYLAVPCGPVTVSNNVAYAIQTPSNWVQGYYDDGLCGATTLSGNTFDAGCVTGIDCTAYAILYPMSSSNPPPLIPPQPHACVAISPYSTQTSMPGCGTSSTTTGTKSGKDLGKN